MDGPHKYPGSPEELKRIVREISESVEKLHQWSQREVISDLLYVDLEHVRSYETQESMRVTADKKASETIELKLGEGQKLPRIMISACAPPEMLTRQARKRAFSVEAANDERRQLVRFWDLDDALSWRLEEIDDKKLQKPGEQCAITFSDKTDFGSGRKISIKATANAKTVSERDGNIQYQITHFDSVKIEITHTPARVKTAAKGISIVGR